MAPRSKTRKDFPFADLRRALGYTQPEMAKRMGLSPRTYFSIETDSTKVRGSHIRIAEMIALEEAVSRRNPGFVPDRVAILARTFADLPAAP